MKAIYLSILLVLFITSTVVYSQTKGSNISYSGGHDSLLFDGANLSSFNYVGFDRNCYIKAVHVKGTAKGTVIQRKYITGCGGKLDSSLVEEYKTISENDVISEVSNIISEDGHLELGVFVAGYSTEMPLFYITVWPDSKNTMPMIGNICFGYNQNIKPGPYEKVERIWVIIGKTTLKSRPDAKPLLGTKGKNASAKHTKTKYSHEVKIESNDTIDVIRVYEGSVEVTYEKTDANEEKAIAKDMGKLSEDFSAGKITAIEYSTKMAEFQSYSVRKLELSKPVTVDEGYKCTVTKISRVVEPLGAGDEDQ